MSDRPRSVADLCRIQQFQVGELPKNSGYIHPYRAQFVDQRDDQPMSRQWDAIEAHVRRSIFVGVGFERSDLELRGNSCLQSKQGFSDFRSAISSPSSRDVE
jgi:hypothetical protein